MRTDMQPSKHDLWASFFVALIVILGVGCALLFMMWLISGSFEPKSDLVPAYRVNNTSSSQGDFDNPFEVPSGAEIEDLTEPAPQQMLDQLSVQDLSRLAAQFEGNQDGSGAPKGKNGIAEREGGEGDQPGDGIGKWLRWELLFSANNASDYAQQLDFFEIELAVFGGGEPGLDYAKSFSSGLETRHQPKASQEKRLYFSWRRATPLSNYERTFLRKAKIRFEGREIVKLVPETLEKKLSVIELEYAKSKGVESVESIAKTVFESWRAAEGFRFRVISQRYH